MRFLICNVIVPLGNEGEWLAYFVVAGSLIDLVDRLLWYYHVVDLKR